MAGAKIAGGLETQSREPLDSKYKVLYTSNLEDGLVFDGLQRFVQYDQTLYIRKNGSWEPVASNNAGGPTDSSGINPNLNVPLALRVAVINANYNQYNECTDTISVAGSKQEMFFSYQEFDYKYSFLTDGSLNWKKNSVTSSVNVEDSDNSYDDTELRGEVNTNTNHVGDLSTLTTTSKNDLVSAVNEVLVAANKGSYTAGTGIDISPQNVISSTVTAKLYDTLGSSTDGALTRKASTDIFNAKADLVGGKIPASQIPIPSIVYTDVTYSPSISLDFTTNADLLTITGNVAFIASTNLAKGRTKRLFITNSAASTSTLTFPTTWKWLGVTPTALSAGKIAVLTLECALGTTDGGIVAGYIAQN